MRLKVQTLSGSIYRVGPDRWERIGRVAIEGGDNGPYNGEPVVVGYPMALACDDGEYLYTTRIMHAEVTDD